MKTFVIDKVDTDHYVYRCKSIDHSSEVSFSMNDIKVLSESSNPFKDKHICQGCGKPLSQCTCEVEEEEKVEEDLNSSSATQSSSVGQYKRDCKLDMFPERSGE